MQAHFLVPVNSLWQRSGKPRFWQEGVSYEHAYNARQDKNYPLRGRVYNLHTKNYLEIREVTGMFCFSVTGHLFTIAFLIRKLIACWERPASSWNPRPSRHILLGSSSATHQLTSSWVRPSHFRPHRKHTNTWCNTTNWWSGLLTWVRQLLLSLPFPNSTT